MSRPLVSIVIAGYNCFETVEKSIKSVIAQTYKNFEVIYIDDASSDASGEKAKKLLSISGRKYTYLRNSKNRGLTSSLNVGLELAKGSLIARIDTDDWWEPAKLSEQVSFLLNHKEHIIVGTDYMDHNSVTGTATYIEKPKDDLCIRKQLLRTTPFNHSSILFWHRDKVRYDERYDTSQDYDLYRQLLLMGKGANLRKPYVHKLTRTKGNISSKKWKRQVINRIKIRRRIFQSYSHEIKDYLFFLLDGVLLLLPTAVKPILSSFRR